MNESQLPVRQDSDNPFDEKLEYSFYAKARNGKKRNYVFDVAKANKCAHRHLMATAAGGAPIYRCVDCNWVFLIPTVYAMPMHHWVAASALQLIHFGKEFGVNSLQEALRQPHGQNEGGPQMGVIPDGMTFQEAVLSLEGVDVNAPDGGDAETRAIVEALWPSDTEVKRRIKALRGSDRPEKQALAQRLEGLLEARHALGEPGKPSEITSGALPALPEGKD